MTSQNLPPGAGPVPAGSAAPTPAFVAASWAALMVGIVAFLSGLAGARMDLNEKGYCLTLLLYGLFAAVSLQKSVRDRVEGIPVTSLYFGLAWVAVGSALLLLAVGLWNAGLAGSEKGFFGMSYLLALFASVAVQKNVRDTLAARGHEVPDPSASYPEPPPPDGPPPPS